MYTTSRYPLEIQWGYVHGMSLDLDKYIYPNCLIKLTAYKKGYEKIHKIVVKAVPNSVK
jgi:hypothetical protein